MKDGTKNIIAACILAVGLIVSTLIYAYSTRYELTTGAYGRKIDKWTGTFEYLERAK